MSTIINRRKRSILCTWFVLVLLLSGGLAEGTRADSLRITSGDPGRAIWVNGTFFGTDEVQVDSLPTETVVIAVGEPLYSAAWIRPWQVVLKTEPGQDYDVHLPALQKLTLRSLGEPMRIELAGRDMGRTPLTLLVPRSEPVHLNAQSEPDAANLFRREWSYEPGGRVDSTLSLGQPHLRPPDLDLSSRGGRATKRGYLLPLGAVVSGVVGVWARQSADRSYDKYLGTVDRDRLESAYDRAERYDRIAISCWATAEAFLVASVWNWLRGEPEGRSKNAASAVESSVLPASAGSEK